MKRENQYVVIMAGGIGSRFWPMSRASYPKQFIDILGTGQTLVQQTFNRFKDVAPVSNIFFVTNESYRELLKLQLPEVADANILGEPVMRNTAPCIAYACHKIAELNPEATIVIAPSDHLILHEERFISTIKESLDFAADNDVMVTLGIVPHRPDTGYGYIQHTELKAGDSFYKVKTFTEKPDAELAKTFLASGDFLWNAGIFIWNARTIIKAFETYLGEINEVFAEGRQYLNTDQEIDFIKTAYMHCRNISIDYGIMEKADNVYVRLSDFGWSDLGTWASVYAAKETKDDQDNVIINPERTMLYDVENCIVSTPADKLVVLQGLKDYIVVESDNVLMVCKKAEEQRVKQFVQDVKHKMGEKFL